MRRHAKYCLAFIGILLLAGCAAGPPSSGIDNDQLPMYGGAYRQADPRLRAADEKLIARLTQEFGSRQSAAQALVDQGVRDFQGGDYAAAMKNFNRAWLLDPDSPDPYWGFAIVYDDQGKSCDAKNMIDKALERNLSKPVALADAGRIYTYCAVSDPSLMPAEKRRYFEKSEELYSRSVSLAPTDAKLFGSWAIAQYWRGHYSDAWKMIKRQRALGGTPGESFLNLLRAKMQEPKGQFNGRQASPK
jgi:Flp pilus assembly protein TadD